jgi:hypothetical protein
MAWHVRALGVEGTMRIADCFRIVRLLVVAIIAVLFLTLVVAPRTAAAACAVGFRDAGGATTQRSS